MSRNLPPDFGPGFDSEQSSGTRAVHILGMQTKCCRHKSGRSRPKLADSGPDLAEMGPTPCEFGRIRAKCAESGHRGMQAEILPKSGQTPSPSPNLSRPNLAQMRPNMAELGRSWAKCARTWDKLVQIGRFRPS